MAGIYDGALEELIYQLGRLPGIGPKSAQRLAFHILAMPAEDAEELTAAISAAKANVHFCEVCGNVTENVRCAICTDERRVKSAICVVAHPKDIRAIESSQEFHGLYHVLGGLIDHIGGVTEADLRIRELLERLYDGTVTEVILALDTSVNGQATTLAVSRLLAPAGITVSRLAVGMQAGSEVEYADGSTLSSALEGRIVIAGGKSAQGNPGLR